MIVNNVLSIRVLDREGQSKPRARKTSSEGVKKENGIFFEYEVKKNGAFHSTHLSIARPSSGSHTFFISFQERLCYKVRRVGREAFTNHAKHGGCSFI